MVYRESEARLHRHTVVTKVACLLVGLFGLVSLVLYSEPSWVGVTHAGEAPYRGKLIWFLTGIGFLVFSLWGYVMTGRWRRRLLWIKNHVTPVQMKLTLKAHQRDSDPTYYEAKLAPSLEGISDRMVSGWRVTLWVIPAGIGSQLNREFSANVFFDPVTGKPAVIEYEHGMLWAMAGNGSVCPEQKRK